MRHMSIDMSQQWTLAAKAARAAGGGALPAGEGGDPSLLSAAVAHRECWDQFWAPQCKTGTDIPEWVQ